MEQPMTSGGESLSLLLAQARVRQAELKKYLQRLKRKKPAKTDELVANIHESVFSETNCLACANCCKTTGPLFTQRDITRLAKVFRVKPAIFVEQWLRTDEDNDLVLTQLPCPFLDRENKCIIYEDRPEACRDYPHTNRRKFYKVAGLTEKNLTICPAAWKIVERLKEALPL